jgi:hypothetical protein
VQVKQHVCVTCAYSWNGTPDDWNGGVPGDGRVYQKVVYISSVSITPFNEPNDVMYVRTANLFPCDYPALDRDACHVWMLTHGSGTRLPSTSQTAARITTA